MKTSIFLTIGLLFVNTLLVAQLRLPAIYSDHMVLQHSQTVKIWGWSQPNAKLMIRSSWGKSKLKLEADAKGKWLGLLPTGAAGGPHTLSIESGEEEIIIRDILLGDVWVCSGQSNMEWPLSKSENPEQAIAAAQDQEIRMFEVKRKVAYQSIDDVEGSWKVCTPENASRFSAVGYYFAKTIREKVSVPMGMIHTSWGGTPVQAWTSLPYLGLVGAYKEELENLLETRKLELEGKEELEKKVEAWIGSLDEALKAEETSLLQASNVSDWAEMKLPQRWEDAGMNGFDGVIWYRKEIEIPAEMQDKELLLELGKIDDQDLTWVNGQEVGSTKGPGFWNKPREYVVPTSLLKPGKNEILIRVVDSGGDGGLYEDKFPIAISVRDRSDGVRLSLVGTWQYKVGPKWEDLPQMPQVLNASGQNSPSALYNGMLEPLTKYYIKGAIWYQGESNVSRPRLYKDLFRTMIRDWRETWNLGDFPFYFVQIAPYQYATEGDAALLREAQLKTLGIRNTGMAVTMDIGDPQDIHPRNKEEVGKRLAYWSLTKDYNIKNLNYSGPVYSFMKMESGKIRLYFESVTGGLKAKGGKLQHFQIAGADKKFYPAEAIIQGETILVTSEQVADPRAVRYAWGNADEASLFNGAGLPASSFRTDSWK